MAISLSSIADQLLAAAKSAGAEAADTLVVQSTSIAIDVRQGSLEKAERSESTDLGLRVLIGQRQATVSTSDTTDATIAEMAERAVAMARVAPEDPHAGLADPDQLADIANLPDLELADPAEEPAPTLLEQAAREAEAAAMAVDGVSQMDIAGASYSKRDIHLAGTNGFSGGYQKTGSGLFAVAISGTGTGMERDYDGEERSHLSDLRSATEIGTTAGERAVQRLGARKPGTGTYPVLFDERISSSLISHLLQAANGSAVARGATWLRDKIGEQILPSNIDLVEEPHRLRITSSRPFDGEGLPTANRKIIEGGRLTGWTLDLATARKLGLKSTGNASRGTAGSPSPTTGNVTLSAGAATKHDLIRDLGTGLLVTSMIGSTINANTGDYSRGASGFWIEDGEIAYPVNECTVAGNLLDMFGRIVQANDARVWLSKRVPSILIDGMSLAGK